jgi:hypothetical protein
MDMKTIMKVGQYPPFDISVNKEVENALGEKVGLYKNAVICESQSYGIGAFAYYRRIVEDTINDLLLGISQLMAGEEKQKYDAALREIGASKNASDKINLVKDLLPPILRPQGINPLSLLHDALSEGLHAKDDAACMAIAQSAREALNFLIHQVAASAQSGKQFTQSMRRLLDRKKPT